MKEYVGFMFSLFALALVLSAIAPKREARILSFAFTVILACAIAAPTAALVRRIGEGEIRLPALGEEEGGVEGIRGAFCRGIEEAIEDEFSLPGGTVHVSVSDFSYPEMTVGHVGVRLTGRAVFADHRAIADYVRRALDAECEVTLDAG